MFKSLAAYCLNPKVRFKDQTEAEVVLLLLRRHRLTNSWWVLVTLILFVLPPLALFVDLLPAPFAARLLPPNFLILGLLTWYLWVGGFVLINFFDWFFNVNLITNQRIVDMDLENLLFFRASETSFANVQDVTYHVSGLPQVLFNFGSVFIQTAGTQPNFELKLVPNPAGVHDLITDLMGKEKSI